jgi:hypothetical protein
MKQMCGILCGLLLAQPAFAQGVADKAEKRLTELLAPGNSATAAASESKPVVWKQPKALDVFVLPIRPYVGTPLRLSPPASVAVKPRSAPEGTPLASYRDTPPPPGDIELETKPLIRLPSVDVATPLPIPILAHPVKDRASLADPAFEASIDAALKAFTPVRDRPVPFTAQNLPDPFENVRCGQLRNPPAESATPPVIPLQKPTK